MKALLLFLCLLPGLAAAQFRADYAVHYAPALATEGLRVEVRVRLPRAADSTAFHYADEVWGERKLMRCLGDLQGSDGAPYRFRLVPDSNRIVVHHPRTRDVRFSYRVRQDAPAYSEEVFNRPRVTDTYFHVLGETLFAVPEAAAAAPGDPDFAATIRWVGFPQGYTLHNTLASGAATQTFRGKLWTQFYRSLYVGGDYRLHRLPYQDRVVHVALRGQWLRYDEPQLLRIIQAAFTAQRDFWQDTRFPYYTVIMSPTVTRADSTFRGYSMKGASVHQGFLLQASNNPFNNWDMLRYMFNHEMLHTWIGGQIGSAREELSYWFTEGFTDYYAYKNRLRSGELSLDEWLKLFNTDVIRRLYNNPQRNQPNYLIKDHYWTNSSFGKLPYRRGALFAFWLDNRILRQSNYTHSLDDLMRELLRDCRQPGQQFTDERLLALAQRYLHEDISYFFQKHILSGADIAWTKADLIEGFDVDTSQPVPLIKATAPAAALRERYLNLKPAAPAVAAQPGR
ncbi:M61 metallopeptidase family protein [Hymenobacter coalescens]